MRQSRPMWYYWLMIICFLLTFQAFAVKVSAVRREDGVYTVDLIRSSLIGTTKVSGLAPGTVFPKLLVRDYDGQRIDLQNINQRMLICYEHVFSDLNRKDVFYQTVARKWAGKLKVVVLYGAKPAKEYAARLKEAGVIVIPNFGYADKYLSQAHVPLVYLVDEKKVVQYRYKFTLNDWSRLQKAVDRFAGEGKIPAEADNFDPVTIGEQFVPAPGQKDLSGKQLTLEDLRGKVTVVLFAPYTETIPALEKLQKKYKDQLNILVTFRYWTQVRVQEVLDYYSAFRIKPDPGEVNEWAPGIEVIKPFFEPFFNSSKSYILIADQDGELFNRFNIFHSNTLMILDTDARLVAGLVAAYAFYDNKEDAQNAPVLVDELIRIIDNVIGR